ncbi:hypothetical protein PDIDSM_4153 [Penicillium digitatum]|nr:hypothetical protein PDIDSM_4153 [Penicillium digitatum]
MTRVPGEELGQVFESLSNEDKNSILKELKGYLNTIRGWSSPWGGQRICSLQGTSISSVRLPGHSAGPFESEVEFNEFLIRPAWSGGFSSDSEYKDALNRAKMMGSLPHRVVFTHGDLKHHNILVQGGKITGFLDWESAGWYPEYWDFTTALRFTREDFWWYSFVIKLGGDSYLAEMDSWKVAEVAMIPKVGKKDKSSVRSWRPIALLSCLSKGLERIVAKRIAWTARTHGVLSPQHAGALPKLSATDLVASFTHDAEMALSQNKQVTLVTMMGEQGWPRELLLLVDSFLTGRKARVRLEGSTTPEYNVVCGTPPGSPLSPVLYMLYLAELLNLDQTLRFGYADDLSGCGLAGRYERR